MAGFARAMTDEEITAAAKYFTSIPATPWISVVERETVPKTKAAGGMLLTREGAEADVESIGERIIETPVSVRDTDLLRSPRSGFIAYVPPGSLKKGEALVPARLVLAVVMAAADREVVFGPNDLRAGLEAAGG